MAGGTGVAISTWRFGYLNMPAGRGKKVRGIRERKVNQRKQEKKAGFEATIPHGGGAECAEGREELIRTGVVVKSLSREGKRWCLEQALARNPIACKDSVNGGTQRFSMPEGAKAATKWQRGTDCPMVIKAMVVGRVGV